ncbi:MAG: nuclear transport factor 2 family protein [Nitrospira sp.]|nr:nuclear transport factor 2 family protein [Nitrospira sp.]
MKRAVCSVLLMLIGSTAWAADDEAAIRALLIDTAKTTSEFSRTRDSTAVLQFYSRDYMGIQDGEKETVETIQQWLAEYGAELDKGSPVRFIGEIYDIQIRLSGFMAWATYDYAFKMVRDGEIQGHDRGLCTAVLRKEVSSWFIQHEHCSKPRLAK